MIFYLPRFVNLIAFSDLVAGFLVVDTVMTIHPCFFSPAAYCYAVLLSCRELHLITSEWFKDIRFVLVDELNDIICLDMKLYISPC